MSQNKFGENLKEHDNELFFVEVKGTNDVRKNILEALKGIVEVLHRFEKFKHIRSKKLEHIQKLKTLLKETNKMLGNLKLKLPNTNLKAITVKDVPKEPKEELHKKNHTEKPPEHKKVMKKSMSELEKLESELSAIESKLRDLT